VDALAPGGTITVAAGTFTEGLTLWKPVVIQGTSKEETILQARKGKDLVISIIAEARGIRLEKLSVGRGWGGDALWIYGQAELQDLQVSDKLYGLLVGGKAKVSLTNSTISGNWEAGLLVRDSATMEIKNSFIQNNKGNAGVGLFVEDSAQVSLSNSRVSDNGYKGLFVSGSAQVGLADTILSGNQGHGLLVRGSAKVEVRHSTIESNGTAAYCRNREGWSICNGIRVWEKSRVTIINSTIRNNTDWGVGASLKQCGYDKDDFTGQVIFEGTNIIESNNKSGNQNGMGNPGNHPWNRPEVPDGQVCLP